MSFKRKHEIQEWMSRAVPGEVMVYFTGHLALKRERPGWGSSDRSQSIKLDGPVNDKSAPVAVAADYARMFYDTGKAFLYQRRSEGEGFDYCIVKRGTPPVRTSAWD